MKKLLIPFIISIFAFMCFTGCSDDDRLEGTLKVTFVNTDDLNIAIYSPDNMQTPIYRNERYNRSPFEIVLNCGNYILKPYHLHGGSSLFETAGFQIKQGATVTIVYDNYDCIHRIY